MTEPAAPPVASSFSYDSVGNLLAKSDIGTYQYQDPAGPYRVTQAGSTTYKYDANGNQFEREGPGVQRNFEKITYDHFNLPKQILVGQDTAQATVDLAYDALEQRVRKHLVDPPTELEQTTVYAEDLYEHIETKTGSGDAQTQVVTHKYKVYGGGQEVAEVLRDEQGGTLGSPRTRYLHPDALGSIEAITDETGATVASIEHDPFGATRSGDAANTGVHTDFTGQEFDAELGLVNMRGRIYDPKMGRFTTADPFVTMPVGVGLNRYAYVFNNPLRYIDPSGFDKNDTNSTECDTSCQATKGSIIGGGIFLVGAGVVYGGPWVWNNALVPAGKWIGTALKDAWNWAFGGNDAPFERPPVQVSYGATVDAGGAGGAGGASTPYQQTGQLSSNLQLVRPPILSLPHMQGLAMLAGGDPSMRASLVQRQLYTDVANAAVTTTMHGAAIVGPFVAPELLALDAEVLAAEANAPGIARLLPGSLPAEEEAALLDTLSHIDSGTVPMGPTATRWGIPFKNNEGTLPGIPGALPTPYTEFRVAPAPGFAGAGARRIVVDNASGNIFYTWTHYGQSGDPGFLLIRW